MLLYHPRLEGVTQEATGDVAKRWEKAGWKREKPKYKTSQEPAADTAPDPVVADDKSK